MSRGGITVCAVRLKDPTEPTRLGVTVHAPRRAVTRNRAKRRVREAFRACGIAPGYEVVIRADDRAASSSFQELVENLSAAVGEGLPA